MSPSACPECGTFHGPHENPLCPRSSIYRPTGPDDLAEQSIRELSAELDAVRAEHQTTLGILEEMRTTETTLIPEERAVLDAMAAATDFSIRENAELGGGWYKTVAKAELARREAAK